MNRKTLAYTAIAESIRLRDFDAANRVLQQAMPDSNNGMSDAFFWARIDCRSTVERIIINTHAQVEGFNDGYTVFITPNFYELSDCIPMEYGRFHIEAVPLHGSSDQGWHAPFVEEALVLALHSKDIDVNAPYLDFNGDAASLMVFAEGDWHEAIIRTDGWHIPLGGGSEVRRANQKGELFDADIELLRQAATPPSIYR